MGRHELLLISHTFLMVVDHQELCLFTTTENVSGLFVHALLRLEEYDVVVVNKWGRKHKDAMDFHAPCYLKKA